jgi:hypothetical protein
MDDGEHTTYCECAPVYETRYEPGEGRTATDAVVEALATVEETDPLELDPLYEAIDLEALERFCAGSDAWRANTRACGFHTDGWNVFVRSDGVVRVCKPDDQASRAPVFSRAMDE